MIIIFWEMIIIIVTAVETSILTERYFCLRCKKCGGVSYLPTKQHKHKKLQDLIKVKLSSLHDAMKMYGGVDVYIHAFLGSILHGRMWSASTHHSCICPIYLRLYSPLLELGRFFIFLILSIHALRGIRTHDPSV
jgi:hypothetical protein